MSSPNDKNKLTPAELLAIERLCDQFENGLRGGPAASLSSLLPQVPEAHRHILLRELLLLELAYRPREARPSIRESSLREFPEFATIIEAVCCDEPLSDLNCTSPHIGTPAPTPLLAPDNIEPGTVIAGKYKLLEAIGEGGMGSVWMAQQIEPVKRTVAVKLIKSGMDSKSVIARFEAERQALSMMDHPNIARVYDVGTIPGGRPFFVMELVKGTPLTEFCDQRKLTPRQRLELFVPICNAIQHAHQKGIIHRDIKPSNVLVALHDDRPVPKVIDFGLAKATGTPLTEKTLHTGFEQVVGTPAYMSPEQATFNQLDIDTRTDVYSLGVLLYELLTGTTPIERQRFKQAALLEMLRVVREEEPPRPSTRLSSTEARASIAAVRSTEPARLSKELRSELDWVVMKSLEKDRSRRYETAISFAADVQRYLAGEPVLAHPPSAGYRIRKFVKRHKGTVVAASIILLALIGGAVGTLYGVIKAEGETTANVLRGEAESARNLAENALEGEMKARTEETRLRNIADQALAGEQAAKREVAFFNYSHAVDLAHREYEARNPILARELLDSCPAELRGWEWHHVNSVCNAELVVFSGHTGRIESASFSPDCRRVVTASTDGTARVWDAITGRELAQLKGHVGAVLTASFSADGRRIVTGSADSTSRVWDAASGKQLALLQGHSGLVERAFFLPDGRVATAAPSRAFRVDNSTRIWNVQTGAMILGLKGTTHLPILSDDGSRFLAEKDRGWFRVWDTGSGKEISNLQGYVEVTRGLFSKDGRRILTESTDGTCRSWDADSGRELAVLKSPEARRTSWAFSRDGHLVVTGSADGTARVSETDTGKALWLFSGHMDQVVSAGFSPDGRRVVTASNDRTARIWDVETGQLIARLQGHDARLVTASFSEDGRQVLTAGDNTARIWDADTGRQPRILHGHSGGVGMASISDDGQRAYTADGITARVWDLETARALSTQSATNAWFSRDHQRVAASSPRGQGRSWVLDVESGKELAEIPGASMQSFSRDGRRVVTIASVNDPTPRVYDAETGRLVSTLKGHTSPVSSILSNEDSRRVVTSSARDGTTRIWDLETGKELHRLEGHGVMHYVPMQLSSIMTPLSRDGRLIVAISTSNKSIAHILEVHSGREIAAIEAPRGTRAAIAFSPDGRRVVTITDNVVKLWDPETGKRLAVLQGHLEKVVSIAFSRDHRRIVTASYDKTARVWDVETGMLMLTLNGHTGWLLDAGFSSDDTSIWTTGYIGSNEGQKSIRVLRYDTRPAREMFRKHLEAPPPRAVSGAGR